MDALHFADKHKTYHIKDEQLNRDGFKKFMKQEACPFEHCRFSRVCNHIHCIRSGCNYVLHSSGQLYSHKRKHERQDNEIAYRKFKLAQSMMKGFSDGSTPPGFNPQNLSPGMLQAFQEQVRDFFKYSYFNIACAIQFVGIRDFALTRKIRCQA